ncbi:DUF5959 family protein [Streptomyces abyssomicinicus]|uniref:DUF5959 family protein n=1 Tax=Streptomyces abyssomicinicus TaxID=574929 RepID=UPI00350E47F7
MSVDRPPSEEPQSFPADDPWTRGWHRFKPQESDGLSVSVHDGPATGITVTLPLSVLPPTWVADQRDLLTRCIRVAA